MAELTPKQERFAEEYLVDLNAKQAAIRAGYSVKTAKETASRLLTYVNVQKKVQLLRQEMSKKTKRGIEQVLNDIYEVGQEARAAGEFSPAIKALELEGKHYGLFTGVTSDKEQSMLEKLDGVLEKIK